MVGRDPLGRCRRHRSLHPAAGHRDRLGRRPRAQLRAEHGRLAGQTAGDRSRRALQVPGKPRARRAILASQLGLGLLQRGAVEQGAVDSRRTEPGHPLGSRSHPPFLRAPRAPPCAGCPPPGPADPRARRRARARPWPARAPAPAPCRSTARCPRPAPWFRTTARPARAGIPPHPAERAPRRLRSRRSRRPPLPPRTSGRSEREARRERILGVEQYSAMPVIQAAR